MSTLPIGGGLEAALGRIDQIQAYQQQLLDPTVATSTATAATSTATAATSGATAASAVTSPASTTASTGESSDFASLLSALQSDNTSGVSAGAISAPTTSGTTVPTAVQNMVSEADSLLDKKYVWGGGHSGWGPQTGYDCSGFVSAVLHAGGYLSTPQDTETLPSAAGIASGPGQYVTIYDRTNPALGEGHVIIDLNGQFYESGGEAGSWGGGGGVEKIDTPSAAYLASFNTILHPAGL